MPVLTRLRTTAIAALAASFTALTPARPLHACSLVPSWQYRGADFVAFFGTATADTVRSGPGRMQPVVEPGHFGNGQPTVPYGQRIRIDRMGRDARRHFGPRATHVVFVPWDHTASCSPVAWTRSARWLTPGTSGLYRAALRPRAQWANGEPTFDVLTVFDQPYNPDPAAYGVGPSRATNMARALTTDELFDLLERMPRRRADPDSTAALRELRQLARDTMLFRRYPANVLLGEFIAEVDAARLQAFRVPMSGTYRVEAWLNATISRTFFMEIPQQADELHGRQRQRVASRFAPAPPKEYDVRVAKPDTRETLAARCRLGHAPEFALWSLPWPTPSPSSKASAGFSHSTGTLSGLILEGVFESNELKAADAADSARPESLPPAGVQFSQSSGGSVSMDGIVVMRGGRRVRVHGTRISADVSSCSVSGR